jgi:hypothetical protein
MAELLSEAWLAGELHDPLAAAAAAAGLEVCFSRAVSGAPDGEARYTARVSGGVATYEQGAAADAEVALVDTYATAVGLWAGEIDPAVAFMQGKTKVAGHTGRWLDLLAAAAAAPAPAG